MGGEMSKRTDTDNIALKEENNIVFLNEVISSFNDTSKRLEDSYRKLKKEISSLKKQLEAKNRELEKNLKEKERLSCFLQNIMESLPLGVVVLDSKGRVKLVNNILKDITGLDLAGKDISPLLEILSIEFKELSVLKEKEVDFIKKDREMQHLRATFSSLKDEKGRDKEKIIIVEDKTLFKKLEIQSHRDKKLKAMGEMALQIAHEIRNPLGSIELFASILRRELYNNDDLRRIVERIITSVKSLDYIISSLLLFTKTQSPVFKRIRIHKLLRDFCEYLQPLVKEKGIVILQNYTKDNPMIRGDEALIRQVFLNLALNAIQAMPKGGVLSISTNVLKPKADDKWWIEIIFKDTGTGIPKENLQKIFHPFFTTKEKGTGLGLAIVHNIIESHKGTIEVESKEGKGTAFAISLPIIKKEGAYEKRPYTCC